MIKTVAAMNGHGAEDPSRGGRVWRLRSGQAIWSGECALTPLRAAAPTACQ